MAKQLHIKLESGVEFVADSIKVTTNPELDVRVEGEQVGDTYKGALDYYLEHYGPITLSYKEAVSKEE